MMQRRKVLGGLGMGLFLPRPLWAEGAPTSAITDGGELQGGGLFFHWQHQGDSLACGLQGQVPGWLAVGFAAPESQGPAHFVIAAPAVAGIWPVEQIGLGGPGPAQRALSAESAVYEGGYAKIAFTLPHRLPGHADLNLAQFSFAKVTLAWSDKPDLAAAPVWQDTYNIRL